MKDQRKYLIDMKRQGLNLINGSWMNLKIKNAGFFFFDITVDKVILG